jgi:hypothetical protein
MGKKALTYWALLIGGFIVVSRATGFGTAVKAVGGQSVALTKALQGR